MDKTKKRGLAKRAKSFKEDIIDILSNLRTQASTSSPPPPPNGKVKPLPVTPTTQANGTSKQRSPELLFILENLPSSINLSQHFTSEINKNILQVKYALKFYGDVVTKKKFEILPGSATVVLETVFNITTTLRNVFPAGEHSSSLLSATNMVHQALSHLIRWSDDILLLSTTKDASFEQISESNVQMEVRSIVDNLEIAINDLVQVVIHKAANKIPPPTTAIACSSPTTTVASSIGLLTEKDYLDGPSLSPNRASKSSEGSLLEDVHSTDWSSDSLQDESDPMPPPKPPLPMKSLLNDFGNSSGIGSLMLTDSSPIPPPLPPKKRSLAGALPAGLNLNTSPSPFSPSWNQLTLPDLVPNNSWVGSLDSISHSSSASHEVFHRQVETRWEGQHQQSVSMATSSTSMFSSSSSSSFTSYNVQQTSGAGFQSTTTTKTSNLSTEESVMVLSVPPALPVKRRQRANRLPSQYDNIDQIDCGTPACSLADFVAVKQEETTAAFHFSEEQCTVKDFANSSVQLRREFNSKVEREVTMSVAPPLPPKKRHIKAYMEMVGPYSQPSEVELFRQSMEAYHLKAAQWHENSEDLFLARASSFLTAPPPLLPPKKKQLSCPAIASAPVLALEASKNPSAERSLTEESDTTPPLLPVQRNEGPGPSPLPGNGASSNDSYDVDDGVEELDLSSDLILKQPEDEGPEVRGGGVDALIIHAAKLNKDDYLYQAAFLTTYRTFISPLELTRKLIHRFHYFLRKSDLALQRAARNAFSLLVGVVDDLALSELDEELLRQIIDFESQLVSSGDLVLAKALRKKFLEKCNAHRLRTTPPVPTLSSLNVSTRQSTLLDFKSSELAEQMTLLDAELFPRIEIPEVLVWAQEQNEEKSPNLTLFTEHFNKMSYWARSRILEQSEAKERERYVIKFIKIMKHLRRLNNFNSYLALLSALDSAPVRRLEWQKSITDGLQEYCALIDSSSSFRAYRQALAETQPPCIPYIGLILQDLTFVHIGNPDLLGDGRINFGKRWQQFHILENMRRFQKCNYPFKRNERIVAFFNDFNDFLCEEAMWQISESIRPRGSNNSATKK